MGAFKEPHGGDLRNLYLATDAAAAAKVLAQEYPSWDLTERQLCDIELLLNGAFSPLDGFLGKDDYDSVVKSMRLTSGVLWPMPITLDVSEKFAASIKVGERVALRDLQGVVLAVLDVGDIWTPDKTREAKAVFGTTDEKHPAVHYLQHIASPVYVGGRLLGIEPPTHYDFKHLRDGPAELRERFRKLGWREEALWHAIIRKNYGCTHLIVGRDHAGPGQDSKGKDFYGPYDAQELLREHEEELDISMVPFRLMVYVENRAQYVPIDETDDDDRVLNISGTELRRRLQEGLEIPEWFSFPDVIQELRRTHPPRHKQGFTVFFTGLSGSGKSTIANALMTKLMEIGGRHISLLDGDVVRKNLSSELGFSKEHRDINIQPIGYVASEITKNGGVAICAPIAPYAATRRIVRDMISRVGGFVEIHVATKLDVCEERDRKGLYAKARAGIIKEFTGISDPYEIPESPEMVIDTAEILPDLAAHRILVKLESMGFIR